MLKVRQRYGACLMNGYQDRVRRHRQKLAEERARHEQEGVSGVDWVGDCVEGVAHALESVRVPHRRRPAEPEDRAE
jgi:hypothetical protein